MGSKKKQEPVIIDPNAGLRSRLSELGVQNLVQFADNMVNVDVECTSTGFPQLDVVLHPTKKGYPNGRNIEVFSKNESSGKSSIVAKIIAHAQKLTKTGLFCDVEDTMDTPYLAQQGCDLDRLLFMEHPIGQVLPAETWLDVIRKLANDVDVIAVDSVAAFDLAGNLSKEVGEADKMSGVAALLSSWLKKNLAKKATIFWINQMRSGGPGGMPGMPPLMVTTGGKALRFYSSIRLELTQIEKIKGPGGDDAPPAGIKTKIFAVKNKIAAPYRSCTLSYIYGHGFSQQWDYMELGIKLKAIAKSGAWLNFGKWKEQGLLKFHDRMVSDPELFEAVRRMVDGDEMLADSNVQQEEPPPTEEEEEEDLEEAFA